MIRLIFISLSSILLLFLGVFGLNQLGRYQAHPLSKHPLFEENAWALFDPPQEAFTSSERMRKWISTARSKELGTLVIPVIPIVQTRDEVWLVSQKPQLAQNVNGTTLEVPVHLLSMEEINKNTASENIFLFQEISELSGEGALAIEVHEKQPSQSTSWTRLLDESVSKNIIVLSPHKFTAKHHRKMFPQWVFGTDASSVLQAMVLQGLYLQSLINVWADFWMSPFEIGGRPVFTTRLVEELSRRGTPVILDLREGAKSEEDWPPNLKPLVKGFRKNWISENTP